MQQLPDLDAVQVETNTQELYQLSTADSKHHKKCPSLSASDSADAAEHPPAAKWPKASEKP